MRLALIAVLIAASASPALAQSVISFDVDTKQLVPGEVAEITGTVGAGLEGQPVAVEITDADGNVILIRTVTADADGKFALKFKVPNDVEPGELDIVTNVELDGQSYSDTMQVDAADSPGTGPVCGPGTVPKGGQCVVDDSVQRSTGGGGCLIATATYGSELAPQVQELREIRDGRLMGTESGAAFVGAFNDIYYAFSPAVADYARENHAFKEGVKIAITPMLLSLSAMEHAESESQVLGIGIGVILLNVGMYVGSPVAAVMAIRRV